MQIRKNKYDVLTNMICLIVLLGTAAYINMVWVNIPDKIPAHYNAAGVVDRWGNKGELLITLFAGWIIFIGLTVLERFPQVWNTGVAVTKENKEAIYRILKNLLNTVKLFIVIMFTFLTVNSSLGENLTVWFLPVTMILLFGSIIFFINQLVHAK